MRKTGAQHLYVAVSVHQSSSVLFCSVYSESVLFSLDPALGDTHAIS